MPSCGMRGCSCDTRDRSKRTPRYTRPFLFGQQETLRRLQKISGLTITEGEVCAFPQYVKYHWLQMGEYKAPAVILHGCVSIRINFRNIDGNRTLVPIRKHKPDGTELAEAIRLNNINYAAHIAQEIHDA